MSGPQPLSKVNPKAEFRGSLGLMYAELHPDLYHLVQRVIALAAYGDQMWGHMFGNLLHAAPIPSFAMYQRLESASAKKAVLMAAAKEELSSSDFQYLQALQKAIGPIVKVRNQFAHHLWGDSPQIPDSLLLADPIIMMESIKWGLQSVALKAHGKPYEEASDRGMDWDTAKIVVWSRCALENAVSEMTRAVTNIRLMTELCLPNFPDEQREQRRKSLLKWPRFAEALQRIESLTPQ